MNSFIFIFVLLIIIVIILCYNIAEHMQSNISIFVISLDRSEDRKKEMNKLMAKGDLHFNYFKAVDGKKMSKEEEELCEKYFEKDKLSLPQRGCFLSHVLLMKKIQKSNNPHTLILEDDATIENFYYIKNLDMFMIDDYDLVYFGHTAEKQGDKVKELYNIHKSVWPRGQYGYMISKKGVEKLLEFIDSKKWNLPIDEIIPKAKLNMYSVFPKIIKFSGIKSTINN